MQNMLLVVQGQHGIYNSDIEPEHDTEYYCSCDICRYQRRKQSRQDALYKWQRAVMYPGLWSFPQVHVA